MLRVTRQGIPVELQKRDQWVTWRLEFREGPAGKPGKWTKVPYDAGTGGHAAVNRPTTWSTFRDSIRAYRNGGYAGVGYVFAPSDPYVGIDLDNCVRPDDTIKRWAVKLLNKLPSYAEVSPSGTGIKVFCRGSLPTTETGAKRYVKNELGGVIGAVEAYQHGRYFTITGARLDRGPAGITDCSAEVERLWASIRPTDNAEHVPLQSALQTPSWVTDEMIIRRAGSAANGARFRALWSGDIHAYASPSEADLALCGMLAFWTGPDPKRIDRLVANSGLFRTKWRRVGYRRDTISTALAERTEFFDWGRMRGRPRGIQVIDAGALLANNP